MNKKIIIIIVLAISLLSIFLMGVLAPKIGQTLITIKVESVKFDHSQETDKGDIKAIVLDEGTRKYQLSWHVYSDEANLKEDATNSKVSFSSNNSGVTVDENGLVTFPLESDNSITVTIKVTTQDGNKTDTINIFVHYPQKDNPIIW